MPITQAIMGSLSRGSNVLPDPGGWWTYMNNEVAGYLRWKIYNAYHNESTDLSAMTLLQDDNTGTPFLQSGLDNRTYMYTGYIQVPAGGNYRFRLNSDDGSYMWLGTSAWDTNFNIGNALINNGGLHGSTTVDSAPIALSGGVWYPVRIMFGNQDGGTELLFQYEYNNTAVYEYPLYANNSATSEGFN